MRPLGIPTVADRVAQMVVKMLLEPLVEPLFHRGLLRVSARQVGAGRGGDGAAAVLALDWVIDLDIKGFFDSLDHDLVERAVATSHGRPVGPAVHRPVAACPVQRQDGSLEQRTKGTPQGGVVSPLLANLFLHYAFDVWMQRTFPRSRSSAMRTM